MSKECLCATICATMQCKLCYHRVQEGAKWNSRFPKESWYCCRKAKRRGKNVAIKMSEKGKKRRKLVRSVKKGFLDTGIRQEGGASYIAGGFKEHFEP